MSAYQLSPAAERDLEEIETFIAADDPAAAARVIDDIEAACQLVATHPGVGRQRDEIAPGVLSFPVGSYVLFYRPGPRAVGIARVLHGRRDLPMAFHAP